MKSNHRAVSLPLAFVAFLVAGFAIGRWSSHLQNDHGPILAKSTVVTSDVNSGDAFEARVPALDATDRTTLDLNSSTPNSNDGNVQTFSFFMGFTR